MTKAEIKALQRKLKDAGLYSGKIDGVMGGGTSAAQRAYNASQAASKAADAAKAKADAEAAKAKANVEAQRLALEAKKLARDNDPVERGIKVAINVGLPILGMVAGHKLAKKIEARTIATANQRAKEIKALGAEARKITGASKAATAKRIAIANTATRMKLGSVKGPLGLATAGLLIAEGTMARFVIAPGVESETAKELLKGVGTASAFAATALVGERIIQNATPKVVPSATAMYAIEQAKAGVSPGEVKNKPKKSPLTPKKGPKGSGPVLRALLPAVAGFAAYSAFSNSAKAGESTGTAIKKGGDAAVDVLSFGGTSTYAERKADGKSTVESVATGTLVALGNYALFGAGEILRAGIAKNKQIAREMAANEDAARRATSGRAYLNANARSKVNRPKAPVTLVAQKASGAKAQPGTVTYTTVDGRSVRATKAQAARWSKQKR